MGFQLTKQQMREMTYVDHTVMINGFVFDYDTYGRTYMVIHKIPEARLGGVVACSKKTLEEHIKFINENEVENLMICAFDIKFLEQCPNVKSVLILPADIGRDGFDYTPLYNMPKLEYVECATEYGFTGIEFKYSTTIDYSKMKRVKQLQIFDNYKNHINFQKIKGLDGLELFNYGEQNLQECFISQQLRYLSIALEKENILSLKGIEKAKSLEWLSISSLKKLKDISILSSIKDTITALEIDDCSKIEDFTVLNELINLEHLELSGRNELPDLQFLKKLKKLKTFVFDMKVKDGDLSECMRIPYVYCQKYYKNYNIKSKALPEDPKYSIWGQGFRYYL